MFRFFYFIIYAYCSHVKAVNLIDLPDDILKEILHESSNITAMHVNKKFYQLITRHHVLQSPKGIQHNCINTYFPKTEGIKITFTDNNTADNIPSWFWSNNVKTVAYMPEYLWCFLKNSKVKNLDLPKDVEIIEDFLSHLSECCANSFIQKIAFSYIRYERMPRNFLPYFFQKLKFTHVKSISFEHSSIEDHHLPEIFSALAQSNIYSVNLSGNFFNKFDFLDFDSFKNSKISKLILSDTPTMGINFDILKKLKKSQLSKIKLDISVNKDIDNIFSLINHKKFKGSRISIIDEIEFSTFIVKIPRYKQDILNIYLEIYFSKDDLLEYCRNAELQVNMYLDNVLYPTRRRKDIWG